MENEFLSDKFYADWSKMTADKIVPAIEIALEKAKKNIAEICATADENCDFYTIIVAFAEATRELERAWGRVRHLEGVENSPELREAFEKVLPAVTEFFSGLTLNEALWRVIKIAAKNSVPANGVPANLTPTERRLLDETLADFRENGADLPADKKKRLAEINAELAQKTAKFTNNVLDATNAWEKIIDDESLLAGVPASALAAAQKSAKSKNLPAGTFRFTLQAPSLSPILQYAENEDLRKEFWLASGNVARGGKFDNTQLIRDILRLRSELAGTLGFKNFADYTTSRRMAKSGENALKFIENLRERVDKFFEQENAELVDFARERGDKTARERGKIAPWSVAFWAEKLRREKYDFDEELLRPYFAVDSVIAGAFEIAQRLFGITIKRVPVAGWNAEVQTFEVFDGERKIGAFYTDWFPRESKRSGAWMEALETAEFESWTEAKSKSSTMTVFDNDNDDDNDLKLANFGHRHSHRHSQPTPHLGLIVGNLAMPVDGKPALLNFLEVTTIFHEFGHLLHHILSEVEIPDLAGTNVAWDFVELPSQILENWCKHAESLGIFAKHFETRTPLPSELLEKLLKAQNFRAANACVRQLSFGKMDLDFHIHPERYADCDFDAYWNGELARYLPPTSEPQPCMAYKFLHLFSDPVGYAAGYYSYKWAEMLEADCFTRFLREGLLNPRTGMEFRKKILARGNAVDAEQLFEDFMGRAPTVDALLEREGLK